MAIGTSGRRGPRTAALKLAAAASAAVVLAACSSTTSTGSSSPSSASAPASSAASSSAPAVDAAALSATVKKLFLTDVPVDSLNPVVKQAVETAAQPWTDANQAKLMECLKTDVCETGQGTLTLAFPNDNINPWRQNFRAELTAQAIQSGKISKIIYSLGTDVASWLANFKSLIAQKPDMIVIDSIYGPAILPAVQQAKAAGIIVVEAETPLPDSVKSVVDVEATSDLCSFYTDAAKQVHDAIGKPGGYGLYTGVPGNASATAWQPCLKKGLESQGWKKAIEGFTQWTPQGMTQQANALYASGKNPDVVAYDYTMEYFAAPYLKDKKTPPIMVSDVVNFAYLKQFKDAKDAGVDVKAFIANSRSWYGRIGVTAALMVKEGQQVDKHVDIPYPSANVNDILPTYDPAMPANAPVPTGFSAAQVSDILAAGS
jgi:ABC-type sugar transport system substrate-binding protein